MRRFRFHLGSLLILVLAFGISFAALRESNEIWDSSIFSITLGVLLISILLAIYRTEKRRAFWLGFALFGSAYLGFSLVPSIEPRLITTRALAFLNTKMPRSIPAGLAYFDYDNDGDMDPYAVNNSAGQWLKGSVGTTQNFMRIGHSLVALIVALLGGQVSQYHRSKNAIAQFRSLANVQR